MDLLICSTSHLVVDGLSAVLERAGHSVIARVDRLEGVAAVCDVVPVEALILDLDVGSAHTRRTVEVLRARHPGVLIVALVERLDATTSTWAAELRLDRVLMRSVRSADLVEALRQPAFRASKPHGVGGRALRLSPSEERVLAGLCAGADTRAIAGALGVAESTVRSHVRAIFDKLGVRSRVAAVLVATSLGLCVPGLPGVDHSRTSLGGFGVDEVAAGTEPTPGDDSRGASSRRRNGPHPR